MDKKKTPTIFWASDPIQPGETVLVIGDSFSDNSVVQVCRLSDSKPTVPGAGHSLGDSLPWVKAKILQASDTSIKFLLPQRFRKGCFVFRMSNDEGWSNPYLLNWPKQTWYLGDDGDTACPGGELRIFGRHFMLDKQKNPTAVFRQGSSISKRLILKKADYCTASFQVPAGIEPGIYEVCIHNGFGGKQGWSKPIRVEVAKSLSWPKKIFNVRDYGAKGDGSDATKAIQSALKDASKNRGGVVYIPRGYYLITDTLDMPRKTVLRGEQLERTILFGLGFRVYGYLGRSKIMEQLDRIVFLPDKEPDLEYVVKGTDSFGIEELQFHFIFARHGIVDGVNPDHAVDGVNPDPREQSPSAGNVFLRRVWFYHTRFMGQPGRPLSTSGPRFDRERMIKERWITVHLSGTNVRIENCRIIGAHRTLRTIRLRNSRISDSIIALGRHGFYEFIGAHNVAIENNEFYGQDCTSSGGGMGTYGHPDVGHFYVGGNIYHDMYGHDREALTTDGCDLAFWHGKVMASQDRIKAPGARWKKDDLIGRFAFVTAGKGRGQWRRICANNTDTAFLDNPWDVVPDETSMVEINNARCDFVLFNNKFWNTGCAVWSFGLGHDFIFDGNCATNTVGIGSSSLFGCSELEVTNKDGISVLRKDIDVSDVRKRFLPNYYIQMLNNRISTGGGLTSLNYGLRTTSSNFTMLPEAVLIKGMAQSVGLIFRNNTLEYDSQIGIGSLSGNEKLLYKMVEDVLLEGNVFRNTQIGIEVDATVGRVLIRKNRYENVDKPLDLKSSDTIVLDDISKSV